MEDVTSSSPSVCPVLHDMSLENRSGRNEFFPEDSFKSWGDYGKAFMKTPFRLKDRMFTRSKDYMEIVEMKARSSHQMKKTLSWWDLIWFGIGAVVGSGIFVLTGLEAREEAGPAVVLSYVVSGTAALLSVFCYTEFAVEIPVAGGSFAYLRVELGDFVAFIAAGNILLEYVIGAAAVARSWTSYFATLCNKTPDDFRIIVHSMNPDYGHLDPIAVVALIAIAILAIFSTKASSAFNKIATILHLFVIIFIIVVGLINANPVNYSSFAPFADLLSVFCYTEFAVEIPVAGGSFAYLRVELGDFVAFIAAENILLDYVIGAAAVARSWTYYFATLCNKNPDDFRIIVNSMNPDYGHLDPIVVVALIAIAILAIFSTKASSVFNKIATILHLFVIVFIIVVGLINANPVNYSSFAPFVSTMAEETKNPGRDIPIGLVGSMVIITFIYCLLASTLCLMQNYKTIDINAPFSVAFSSIGWGWAKYIVALGALKGMTTVLAMSDGWIGWAVTAPLWLLGTGGVWFLVPEAKKPKVWGGFC
ncbi:hypothetical protein TSUD_69360 [Trifolium subterraneum]|uniref:Amino acid permease/ SLC12A domain-containing protein n=1 Tax=Trifolium subterraneum TaxID=3900 RepID=A0A2Z6N1F7_TRISU|nr:hypothetical protein TSUD_69360 [Trifolium subterraneum]